MKTVIIKGQDPHLEQIFNLYRESTWISDSDTIDKIDRVISNSYLFCIAISDKNEAVGMGRVISDGVSDAYIQDVYVSKDHRHQNIGSLIISHLTRELKHAQINWIGLVGVPGTVKFYGPLGFKPMIDHTPMLYEGSNA